MIYGMTTPIPLISPMYYVMEMKQDLQAVDMKYHHFRPVTIMVLLQCFVRKV